MGLREVGLFGGKMPTDLEKQFFDTFGIEPKLLFYDLTRLKEDTNQEMGGRCNANWQGETKEETIRRFAQNGWKVLKCEEVYCYPQITDKILLKLICINNSCAFEQKTIIWEEVIMPTSYKYLKESVLSLLMLHRKDFSKLTHQVQAIFEVKR